MSKHLRDSRQGGSEDSLQTSEERDRTSYRVPIRQSHHFPLRRRTKSTGELGLWIILVAIAYWHARTLSARGPDLGPDIQSYFWFYDSVGACQCLEPRSEPTWEFVWSGFALLSNGLGFSATTWLTLVILIQGLLWLSFTSKAAVLLGFTREAALAVLPISLLMLQTYPFLVSGQTNVLRSGVAIPLGALATVALVRGNWLSSGLLSVGAIATQFQVGLIVTVGVLAFGLLKRTPAIWGFAALSFMYAVGASGLVASKVVPYSLLTQVLDYATGADYRTGVRLDFLAFTILLFVLVASLSRAPSDGGYEDRLLPWLTGLAVPFLLVGGTLAYSDRWIQPFWSIAPIIIAILVYRRLPNLLQLHIGMSAIILVAILNTIEAIY